MKMTVTTETKKSHKVIVPHKLMMRFIRSLGFPVDDGTSLHMFQLTGVGPGGDLYALWDTNETSEEQDVSGIAVDDIELCAALASPKDVVEYDEDIPF